MVMLCRFICNRIHITKNLHNITVPVNRIHITCTSYVAWFVVRERCDFNSILLATPRPQPSANSPTRLTQRKDWNKSAQHYQHLRLWQRVEESALESSGADLFQHIRVGNTFKKALNVNIHRSSSRTRISLRARANEGRKLHMVRVVEK